MFLISQYSINVGILYLTSIFILLWLSITFAQELMVLVKVQYLRKCEIFCRRRTVIDSVLQNIQNLKCDWTFWSSRLWNNAEILLLSSSDDCSHDASRLRFPRSRFPTNRDDLKKEASFWTTDLCRLLKKISSLLVRTMGRKNYCICGGLKWEILRGKRRLMPCFWQDQPTGSGCSVGTGPLGLLHPQCLLARICNFLIQHW